MIWFIGRIYENHWILAILYKKNIFTEFQGNNIFILIK